ncbi:anaphase-promoting complex, cyclosome, subunit 4-domain-containing protein, partial [Infundibulicybe gibba]
MATDVGGMSCLAAFQLPSPSRLLSSACCPDKDLVALISRLGGQDRLSLWKIQGSKTWEVDVGGQDNNSAQIVDLAWSPDGQSIAVAQNPPRVSLYALEDGQEILTLPIAEMPPPHGRLGRINAIWWFQDEKRTDTTPVPDIFRRGDVITGTAHSILKMLPLLDHLQEDSQKLTATDLFAFQGSQTRTVSKSQLPEVIKDWPSLAPDPLSASVGTSLHGKTTNSTVNEEADLSNFNSILAFSDDQGHLLCYLDGNFPLGVVSTKPASSTFSLHKHVQHPLFLAHPHVKTQEMARTYLYPVVVKLPLLEQRVVRDLAKLTSTARELTWYIMRVVKEMRAVWFGSEMFSGARELGPKWIRTLEAKQKEQFGQMEPNPILDLTCLLATGRASEPLLDFLGSSENMSERGIQKWESTVSEALVKLRDFAEKRVAPACQRLHIVLEEIQGCSQLRAIVIASWLPAVARRELFRFREFIAWLRFETTALNSSSETNISSRHDILEVNNYLISGLVVSSIDKWFLGPVPQFSSRDLGIPTGDEQLVDVLHRARNVANDHVQMEWQAATNHKDLSHIDRNLDALIHELAIKCHRVFARAAGAASRSASISSFNPPGTQVGSARPQTQPEEPYSIRERIVAIKDTVHFHQYLAIYNPSEDSSVLCLARLRFNNEGPTLPVGVEVVLSQCYLPEESAEGGQAPFEILEAEFFDDA